MKQAVWVCIIVVVGLAAHEYFQVRAADAASVFVRALQQRDETIASQRLQLAGADEKTNKGAEALKAMAAELKQVRKVAATTAEEAAKKARDAVDGVKRQLEVAEEAKRGAVAEKDKLDAALKDKEGQVSRLRDDLEKAKKPSQQCVTNTACECRRADEGQCAKAKKDLAGMQHELAQKTMCCARAAPNATNATEGARQRRLPCPEGRLLRFVTNYTDFIRNTFAVAQAATTPNHTRPIKYLFSDELFPKLRNTVPKDGLVLEFGVFRGDTLSGVADYLYEIGFKGYIGGFDSWEGLPVKWRDRFEPGAFGPTTHGDVWSVVQDRFKNRTHVHLHKGWFQDTLPALLESEPAPITHLHIDGDLFVSAAIPLQLLTDRIVAGSLITFDELYKYKDFEKHEILELYLWMGQTGNELCALANRDKNYFRYPLLAEVLAEDQSLAFQVVYTPKAFVQTNPAYPSA